MNKEQKALYRMVEAFESIASSLKQLVDSKPAPVPDLIIRNGQIFSGDKLVGKIPTELI